jgi:hypothetical protein
LDGSGILTLRKKNDRDTNVSILDRLRTELTMVTYHRLAEGHPNHTRAPQARFSQCDRYRILVHIQTNIGDKLFQDPSPMHEARHRTIRRNPRKPAYCETGRPYLRRTSAHLRHGEPAAEPRAVLEPTNDAAVERAAAKLALGRGRYSATTASRSHYENSNAKLADATSAQEPSVD